MEWSLKRDKAIVTISAEPPGVMATKLNPKGTLADDRLTPPDGTVVSRAPVKNIVVEISGDEKDLIGRSCKLCPENKQRSLAIAPPEQDRKFIHTSFYPISVRLFSPLGLAGKRTGRPK